MDDADTGVTRFAWVDEEEGFYPVLNLVRGCDEDEVLHRFGADPSAARMLTLNDIYALQPENYREHRYFVSVGTVGPVVFTLEVVGSTGDIPETMRRLSVGGRCFGVSIALSGGDNVRYAVDGELVVYEEPWGPVKPLRAGDARWDPNWCEELLATDDPDEIWGLEKLALAERVMQTRIEEEWIRGPLRTVELPDPICDPQSEQLWRIEPFPVTGGCSE